MPFVALSRLMVRCHPRSWRERHGADALDTMDSLVVEGRSSLWLLASFAGSACANWAHVVRTATHRQPLTLLSAGFAAVVLTVLTIVSLGTSSPQISARAAALRLIVPVSAPPAAGSPPSAWRSWAKVVAREARSTPWTKVFSGGGCSVSSVSFVPGPVDASGAPRHLDTLGVSVTGRCPTRVQPVVNR